MENNTAVKLDNYSNMSEKEFMLIQALVKEKLERGEELEYEKFDGYELPPSTQFSMLKKPTVTIKYGKLRFNMAAIRLFSGIKYILPMLNGKKKRLVAVPRLEEESASVEWARIRKKDEAWVNKDISSVEFVDKIFNVMGWEKDSRYKVIGRIINSEKGLCLLFELDEAVQFTSNKIEVVNPLTGKTSTVNEKIYPKQYENKIGIDYNDYISGESNSTFENLGGYAEKSSVGNTFDSKSSLDDGVKFGLNKGVSSIIGVSAVNDSEYAVESSIVSGAEITSGATEISSQVPNESSDNPILSSTSENNNSFNATVVNHNPDIVEKSMPLSDEKIDLSDIENNITAKGDGYGQNES